MTERRNLDLDAALAAARERYAAANPESARLHEQAFAGEYADLYRERAAVA